MHRIAYALEIVLILICRGTIIGIKAMDSMLDLMAKIVKTLIFLAIFTFSWHYIGELPIFWQSLTLNTLIWGGALTFISLATLLLWRPEKFSEILEGSYMRPSL